MKSIASKKAGPGGTSSYISPISTQLNMHRHFGLSRNIVISGVRIGNKVLKSPQIYSYVRFLTFKVSCSQHYLTVGIQLL